MMLHRHFEAEKSKNITKLKDVTPGEKKAEPKEETPKRSGRPKKSEN